MDSLGLLRDLWSPFNPVGSLLVKISPNLSVGASIIIIQGPNVSQSIHLLPSDLKQIQNKLNLFPGVESFDVIRREGGGIGYFIDISFDYEVNGQDVKVTVPVVGVEEW